MGKWLKGFYTRHADVVKAVSVITVVLFVSWFFAGCAGKPVLQAGVGFERHKTFGEHPSGIVRLKQPLQNNWFVEFEHISSIPDEHDRTTVDQLIIGKEFELF